MKIPYCDVIRDANYRVDPKKMLNPPLLMHPANRIRFLTTMIR